MNTPHASPSPIPRQAPSARLAFAHRAFLDGCDLPRRWAGLAQWRILDTGFAAGERFLATWSAWRADEKRPRMLHFVAIDAHPLGRQALLDAWAPRHDDPRTAPLVAALAEQWHGLLPGLHRLSFDEGRVLLTLCVGEARPMLRAQQFEADSIFMADASAGEDGDSLQEAATRLDAAKAVARFARVGTCIAIQPATRTQVAALAHIGFRLGEASVGAVEDEQDEEDEAEAIGAVRAHAGAGAADAGAERDADADAETETVGAGPPSTRTVTGEFAPAWTVRRRAPLLASVEAPGDCAVIGAGLAGAAVAASLARRGWRVTVLEAGDAAAGASGVPVGVFAPHVSPDDALLSRLTRAGVRLTRQQMQSLLRQGTDWRGDGVLERRAPGADRLPPGWSDAGPNESRRATPSELGHAGLPPDASALFHAAGGWAKPSRLVRAWLGQPGVRLLTHARVASIEAMPGTAHEAPVQDQKGEVSGNDPASEDAVGNEPMQTTTLTTDRAAPRWLLCDADGAVLARADRVVIAAGFEGAALAPRHPLQPVRGQVAWGRMDPVRDAGSMPRTPLNGDGHLIAQVPEDGAAWWLTGATFERDCADTAPRAGDAQANLARLARLHPATAAALAEGGPDKARAWVGIRCASADRRPLVGPVDPDAPTGPWLCTAMGSRGLSFAVLCAELLAARWHGEPLPLPTTLAAALDASRALRAQRPAAG